MLGLIRVFLWRVYEISLLIFHTAKCYLTDKLRGFFEWTSGALTQEGYLTVQVYFRLISLFAAVITSPSAKMSLIISSVDLLSLASTDVTLLSCPKIKLSTSTFN